MKTKEFTITENILASQGQRFLNVIIDLVFIYILILSAGTTIVLIAEATNNFAVSSWVENMNFVEIIAIVNIVFLLLFNRSLFLANLGEINYSNYCCQKDGSKLQSK
jgi:hypothetical protein